MKLVQIFISLPLSFSSLGLQKLFCRARLKSAMYNRLFLPRGLTKRFSKGLRFEDLGGFSTKRRPPWFRVNWRLTKCFCQKVGDPSQPKLLYDTIRPIFWLIHWNVWTVLAAPTKKKNNNNMCFLSPILRLNHFAIRSQPRLKNCRIFTLCYWTA